MSNWYPLAQGVDGNIFHFAQNNHVIVAGGEFTRAGTKSVSNIAVWDGFSWFSVPGNGLYKTGSSGNTIAGKINSIVQYDGKFFIGGDFNSDGNRSLNNIAILKAEPNLSWEYKIVETINTDIPSTNTDIPTDTDIPNITTSIFSIPGYDNEVIIKLKVIHNQLYAIFHDGIRNYGIVKIWNNENYEWEDAGWWERPNVPGWVKKPILVEYDPIRKLWGDIIELPNNEIWITAPVDGLVIYFEGFLWRSRWGPGSIDEYQSLGIYNIPVLEKSTESIYVPNYNFTQWNEVPNVIPKTQLVGSSVRKTHINVLLVGNDNQLYVGGSFKRIGSSQQNSGGKETFGVGRNIIISGNEQWDSMGSNSITALPNILTLFYSFATQNIPAGLYGSGNIFGSAFNNLTTNEKVAFYNVTQLPLPSRPKEFPSESSWPPYGSELIYANSCDPYNPCIINPKNLCTGEDSPKLQECQFEQITADPTEISQGGGSGNIFVKLSDSTCRWKVTIDQKYINKQGDESDIPGGKFEFGQNKSKEWWVGPESLYSFPCCQKGILEGEGNASIVWEIKQWTRDQQEIEDSQVQRKLIFIFTLLSDTTRNSRVDPCNEKEKLPDPIIIEIKQTICFLDDDRECVLQEVDPLFTDVDASDRKKTHHSFFVGFNRPSCCWKVFLCENKDNCLELNDQDIYIDENGKLSTNNNDKNIITLYKMSNTGIQYGSNAVSFMVNSQNINEDFFTNTNGDIENANFKIKIEPGCDEQEVDFCSEPQEKQEIYHDINLIFSCPNILIEDQTEEAFEMPYQGPDCWAWSPNYKPPFYVAKVMSSVVKIQVDRELFERSLTQGLGFGLTETTQSWKGYVPYSLYLIGREIKDCKYYLVFRLRSNLTAGSCGSNNGPALVEPSNLYCSAEYNPIPERPYWEGVYRCPCGS